ncbi:MAG TPA: ABC transporter family substrate-binding protein [Actinomycetota bacterium]
MHGRRSSRWLLPLLGLALIAAACSSNKGNGGGGTSGGGIKEGGSLNYAADQEPTGFNNNTSKDHGTSVLNITVNMFPNAFNVAPDLTVHLNSDLLASADLTKQSPETIVYKIKPNASWSDGTPFSADDFIYAWQHQNGTNPKFDVADTTGYANIKSVTGSDNGKTVTVVYSKPFADWKNVFTQMLPAHYMKSLPGSDVQQWNDGIDKNPEKIPSAGPFVVQSYTVGNSLTLKRNDQYFGQKAHLGQIVFRFLPASTAQPQALQNSEVDLIYPQPQIDEVKQVQALPDVTSQINFGLSFEHLDFNFKNQFLGDLKVRQAIATGLNREDLVNRTVKQFSDKASVLGNRIWLSGQQYYEDHSGNYGKGDVNAAKALLQGDGYTMGSDGYFAKGGKRLEVRFSTTAGNQLREQQGVLFQSQMKAIGIKVDIANVVSKTFFGDWLPKGNYDVADFAWVGNPFAISNNHDIYRTGGGGNYGKLSDPKIDSLFNQAIAELDPAKSAALGNQIDQQIWNDMATIPLYQKPTFIAWRNTFTNIVDNTSQYGPFTQATSWAQKA